MRSAIDDSDVTEDGTVNYYELDEHLEGHHTIEDRTTYTWSTATLAESIIVQQQSVGFYVVFLYLSWLLVLKTVLQYNSNNSECKQYVRRQDSIKNR